MKTFNTTAVCFPNKHYMVDISDRVAQIRQMVDDGKYFCINRARQYGKTTTLRQLRFALQDSYTVISLDFQAIGHAGFTSEGVFSQAFIQLLLDRHEAGLLEIPDPVRAMFDGLLALPSTEVRLDRLFRPLDRWCRIAGRPVVLMIDEVDSASNNQVFLDFLAQLRLRYIEREDVPTFQSVILASVTDIRNLKRKIRPDETAKVNSPWNIAADYEVEMGFDANDVAGMLRQYEADHATGMDIDTIACLICDYTGGYPFLVSRLCQLMDQAVSDSERFPTKADAWTRAGVEEAVRLVLAETNTLFESLMGKVINDPRLDETLRRILFAGKDAPFNPDELSLIDALSYGFIKASNGKVRIANRIFETRLYNYYLTTAESMQAPIFQAGSRDKGYVADGRLDMEHVLSRFIESFTDIYGTDYDRFDEDEGRRRFLLFLKPIINGTGNFYVEARTRDEGRMDVVVDYLGQRSVVELKIWRGAAYNEKGEWQLAGYLDQLHLDTGYLLTYSFSHNKQPGLRRVEYCGKTIVEALV